MATTPPDLPIMALAARYVGTRVHVHYRTRTIHHAGTVVAVWGDNEAGVDSHAVAHVTARVMAVTRTHVVIQPENLPRPVAIHATSMVQIRTAWISRSGLTNAW